MRLRVITPITTQGFMSAEAFASVLRPDTELSHVAIERGPTSIESEFDSMLAAPDTVAKIVQAERDGMDAVIINCMDDPGMKAAREMVAIPVVGPGEATMHVAAMLGHSFSVLTVLDWLTPMYVNHARIYGVADKLASVRSVDIPVLELESDEERLVRLLTDQAVRAIEEDDAHVMIFGCTGMLGTARRVQDGLVDRGYPGVPVIDSMVWAIKMAEALADMELSHSKRTYPYPPRKMIVGYDVEPAREAVPAD